MGKYNSLSDKYWPSSNATLVSDVSFFLERYFDHEKEKYYPIREASAVALRY
jgi:hypothetical protein